MEIFIIFLCISQIFLYLIWLWLYSEFQELKNVVACLDHDLYKLLEVYNENESQTKEK